MGAFEPEPAFEQVLAQVDVDGIGEPLDRGLAQRMHVDGPGFVQAGPAQQRGLGLRGVEHAMQVGGEDPAVETVSDLYPAANWMEREVWDMFGIRFKGHGNLERILMWEGFEGHPLRKDYPLLGNTPGTPGYVGKGGKR